MGDAAAASAAKKHPWADDPLGCLIAPHDSADFFAHLYERKPLIVSRNDPDRYADLLSIEAIDALIAGGDLRDGQIDLANAADQIRKEAYIQGGIVDRGMIARQYQGGATIILQQLHQSNPTLAAFCRAVEHVFSAHTQTNIYLTPPTSQGFRTHYDNHDVFVLQVSGEKSWRLYDTPIEAPYRGEGFEPKAHEVGEVKHEFLLKAGDCAYVPRGLMHDAATSGDAPSLHITVGLIVRTWADLMLEAVSEVALKEPAFRRALPAGYARPDFDRAGAEAQFHALLEMLPKSAKLDAAFDLMIDGFVRSRLPDLAGAVRDGARPIAAEDRFRARRFTPWRLAEEGEKLILVAPGGEVEFTGAEEPALRRALSSVPFTLADLHGADAELIRKLHAFGLIERL
ncbi:MAG: cupin domain-containing protein [Hyphomonadaceae bacterium]